MKRALLILAGLIAAVAILVTGSAAGGEDGKYEVRAIFDNAAFLVPGEEVRIAGAKVGEVAEIDISGDDEVVREDGSTDPGKAVVVLNITDPGFQDFRTDASCLIRPQSLIGEKFVECRPTEPRAAGTPAPPELELIGDDQPGAGQRLLPLERNGTAVDLDLVNNIMREPYPDRFRLIINSLGASFAARGEELAEIIQRSNPALRETNEVLGTLAEQNEVLSKLASDSDAVIGALARKRENIADFINTSNTVAAATAERSADLERSFQEFPHFLVELRSTMEELDAFSRAATPVFTDLGNAAPALTRATEALTPVRRGRRPGADQPRRRRRHGRARSRQVRPGHPSGPRAGQVRPGRRDRPGEAADEHSQDQRLRVLQGLHLQLGRLAQPLRLARALPARVPAAQQLRRLRD